MAQYSIDIQKVLVNGPYSYVIIKDGVGQKSEHGLSLSSAMNGVRDDVSGLLGAETVTRILYRVVTT